MIAAFDRKLWQPPKVEMDTPIPAESPWSAQSEQAAFAAFAADFNGL